VSKFWKDQNISRQGTKAQRRKGNKAIILCDLCVFVRRLTDETVYFFKASPARAFHGQDGRATVITQTPPGEREFLLQGKNLQVGAC
jgi:hypothetical protein